MAGRPVWCSEVYLSLYIQRHVYLSSWFISSSVIYSLVQSLSHVQLFCDPMDGSLPGSPVHGVLQARILECICHCLLQGIFPTQGSNPRLLCLVHWQTDSFIPVLPTLDTLYFTGFVFCDWLILRSILSSRCIHVVTCDWISLLFKTE